LILKDKLVSQFGMPRKVNLPTVGDDNVPALFPPGDHRKTIDLKQLAELTGIEGPTLRDWIRRGIVGGAFQRKDHGKWRFRREALEVWWRELLRKYNMVPRNGHDLPQFSPTYVPPPQSVAQDVFDAYRKGYQEGYRDGMANKPAANLAMHTTQNDGEDLGLTFINPYPSPKETARRRQLSAGAKQDQ
jgi:Helix-turn-helix domain